MLILVVFICEKQIKKNLMFFEKCQRCFIVTSHHLLLTPLARHLGEDCLLIYFDSIRSRVGVLS